MRLKWNPKDPDGLIGVPGRGFIKCSDFCQADLDNLINRAKNRQIDVHSFLLSAGLLPAVPQLELIEDVREFEKSQEVDGELNPHAEPKRKRRTKAEMEADK